MSSSERALAKGRPSAEAKDRRTVPKVGRWGYNDIGPPRSRRQPGGVGDKEGPSTSVKVGQEGPAASWMNGQQRPQARKQLGVQVRGAPPPAIQEPGSAIRVGPRTHSLLSWGRDRFNGSFGTVGVASGLQAHTNARG